MSWQVFLSVLGKGGFKGKTLARGKRRDQFTVGNSLEPAPREVGSAPAPYTWFWDGGGAACVPETPPRTCFPSKTKCEDFPLE